MISSPNTNSEKKIFNKIQKEMKKIVQANYPLERFELPRAEAIKYMEERNEPYKVELINDLPEDAVISFYKQGDFVDLCAGPHMDSTGQIKAFKLMSVAGAYWRGDSDRQMLQRIYATAFPVPRRMLDEYITKLEEAKKRDHRKIGKEMDLFMLTEEGPGFPFFLPKGMIIRNELEAFWRAEHRKRGYEEIKTPLILNEQLWRTSGHWDHYKDNMYFTKIDDEDYAIKPMNCPGSMLVYKRKMWSYRDFPIRCGELGQVHRHELSGALHGLMRVRTFTQDDAHIFMLPEQVNDEIKNVARFCDDVYKMFGFEYHVELSTRPEDSMGIRRRMGNGRKCSQKRHRGNGRAVRDQRRGRRFLRTEAGLPSAGFHRKNMAVRNYSAGHADASAIRSDLYRTGRRKAQTDHDSQSYLRFHRAVHRYPDRALRRKIPAVAGSCTGKADDSN